MDAKHASGCVLVLSKEEVVVEQFPDEMHCSLVEKGPPDAGLPWAVVVIPKRQLHGWMQSKGARPYLSSKLPRKQDKTSSLVTRFAVK